MTRRKEIYNSRLFKHVKNNCTKFMPLIYRSGERHEVSELRLKSCADERNIISGGSKAGVSNAAVCARRLWCGTWELDLNVDEKHCGNKSIVAQPDSNLPPSGQ